MNLIKFEPAKLPTVPQAKAAIDKAQTVAEVVAVKDVYEAARVYWAQIQDYYKEADADEVKQYALRKIGLIYEANKNPVGRPIPNDSGAESLTTRQIEGNILSAHQLQKARVVGRMSEDEFEKHTEKRKYNIVNRRTIALMKGADKQLADSRAKFSNYGPVVATHIEDFMRSDHIARNLEAIEKNLAHFTIEELEIVSRISKACQALCERASRWSVRLPQYKEIEDGNETISANGR